MVLTINIARMFSTVPFNGSRQAGQLDYQFLIYGFYPTRIQTPSTLIQKQTLYPLSQNQAYPVMGFKILRTGSLLYRTS